MHNHKEVHDVEMLLSYCHDNYAHKVPRIGESSLAQSIGELPRRMAGNAFQVGQELYPELAF